MVKGRAHHQWFHVSTRRTWATADSSIVDYYRKAGLVIFGKSNTPELGLEPVTEPEFVRALRAIPGTFRARRAAPRAGRRRRWPADRAGGARQRWWRLDPGASVLLGPVRHEADPGAGCRRRPNNEGWGGFSIQHAVHPFCARQRRPAGRRAQAPARRSLLGAGRRSGRIWRRRPATRASCASPSAPRRCRPAASWTRRCAQAVREAAKLCESLGHQVEEVKVPGDAAGARNRVGPDHRLECRRRPGRRGRPKGAGPSSRARWMAFTLGFLPVRKDHRRQRLHPRAESCPCLRPVAGDAVRHPRHSAAVHHGPAPPFRSAGCAAIRRTPKATPSACSTSCPTRRRSTSAANRP